MRRLIFILFFVILSFNLVIAADVKVNLEADNLNPINGQQVTVNVLIESDDVDYPFEILSPYILIESSDKENLILDLNGAIGLDGNIYDSLLQNKVHSGFVSFVFVFTLAFHIH